MNAGLLLTAVVAVFAIQANANAAKGGGANSKLAKDCNSAVFGRFGLRTSTGDVVLSRLSKTYAQAEQDCAQSCAIVSKERKSQADQESLAKALKDEEDANGAVTGVWVSSGTKGTCRILTLQNGALTHVTEDCQALHGYICEIERRQ